MALCYSCTRISKPSIFHHIYESAQFLIDTLVCFMILNELLLWYLHLCRIAIRVMSFKPQPQPFVRLCIRFTRLFYLLLLPSWFATATISFVHKIIFARIFCDLVPSGLVIVSRVTISYLSIRHWHATCDQWNSWCSRSSCHAKNRVGLFSIGQNAQNRISTCEASAFSRQKSTHSAR